jgi:transcriptional regulator GlxA family with amidase domain
MPSWVHFRPMRILLVAFPECSGLDVSGPAEVFASANRGYDVIVVSASGGPQPTTAGYDISTRALSTIHLMATDTVLVVGGERAGVEAACADRTLIQWLTRAARTVRRVGSVCTGAFILSATGLLDGRRVATHWAACARLAAFRQAVAVDRDAIFIEDGRYWTSAGVTAGIDMALAMVESDQGRSVADAVAAELVVYTRRLGFQSQWSEALVAQIEASDPLSGVIAWARGHLRELDVSRLARRAGMSVRSLHRRCDEVLKLTPAKLIEQLRLEQARTLLASGRSQAKVVARVCGFGTSARMAAAFRRSLGVLPGDYRRMFAGAEGSPRAGAPPPAARFGSGGMPTVRSAGGAAAYDSSSRKRLRGRAQADCRLPGRPHRARLGPTKQATPERPGPGQALRRPDS